MQLLKNCLILHGGVDINPVRYNQRRNPMTQHPNNTRDELEFKATRMALERGLPVIGICRGAQLLTILHGGSLWQHTDNHCKYHPLITKEGFVANATSCHHQVMNLSNIPTTDYQILAFANSPERVYGETMANFEEVQIPEVVWFPKTKCLAIQPHPEWEATDSPFRRWLDPKVVELLGFKIDF